MASPLPISSSTSTLSTAERGSTRSSSTPPEDNSYLNRCLEVINNSSTLAKTQDRYATAYKVAGCAIASLFIIAAAAAVILTGIYAPVFVPVTMITIVTLTNKVLNCVRKNFSKAASYELTAKRIRAITTEYDRLLQPENILTSQKTIQKLAPLEATTRCDRLIPLLAHYNYWNSVQEDYQAQTQAKEQEATNLEPEKSVEKYVEASKLRQLALVAKTCAAFTIAAMNNPTFQGVAEDLCTINSFSIPANLSQKTLGASLEHDDWTRHAILRDFGDRRADNFVVFKNKNIQPISFGDAIARPNTSLSKSYLQAMRAGTT